MSLEAVCEAWADDLVTHVSGLADAKVHLYAGWSREMLASGQGERHLAVYPREGGAATPFVTGTPPGDEVVQGYTILIWEDAASEGTRLYDDDDANRAWLRLFEQVQGRLMVFDNTALGEPGATTRFADWSPDLLGTTRLIRINFDVRSYRSFT